MICREYFGGFAAFRELKNDLQAEAKRRQRRMLLK
jgi:hypothetical protein